MTAKLIKQLVQEQQELLTEWLEFLKNLEGIETEFVNKMIEWMLDYDKQVLLYRMFHEKIVTTNYTTFIKNLMQFIRYDINDDGGCKIRWVKYKFYVEDLEPGDDTSMDLVDCSPEDENGFPLVVDHENYTSLEDLLKAMNISEQRELKRIKNFDESQ
jgi:hypothetical protein